MHPRIAILGLGLIGGSLWRKLAEAGYRVSGYDIDPATREAARETAATLPNRNADRVADHVRAAVVDAEIVVMCIWPPDIEALMHDVHEAGYRGLLTDVTSVKEPVQRIINKRYPGTRWIGGHPMAGFERAGFTASTTDLFNERPWVLCIDEDAKPASTMRDWLTVAQMLTSLDIRVIPLTAREHDDAVARISHVPHMAAAALTQVAAAGISGPSALTLAAGSFKDGTRVAASPPDRTASFCGWNAEALGREMDQLIARLTQLRTQLRGSRDAVKTIRDWIWPSYVVRNAWPPTPGKQISFPASPARLLELGRAGGWVQSIQDNQITAVMPSPMPLR